MTVPDFLYHSPPAHTLYLELHHCFAAHPALLAHAPRLAFRGVMHAVAWLGEQFSEFAPFHARIDPDSHRITYHFQEQSYDAARMHQKVLLLHPMVLTHVGSLIAVSLEPAATVDDQRLACSAWRTQLHLMCRYGPDFDLRFRNAGWIEGMTA